MLRQVLFIQGGGPRVHDAWDDKLVDSLKRALGADWEVRYPRMPSEDDPKYAEWKAAIGRELAKLDDGAVLVAHSLGGMMLVHALAEEPPKRRIGVIVLIAAPFAGEGGWPSDEIAAKPDLGAKLPEGVPVYLFHGDDDRNVPPAHAELYARAIPQARLHRLRGRDHQLNNNLGEIAAVLREVELASS